MRLNMTFIGNYSSDVCSSELTAMQRARQKRSMADMRTIATAWESRATEVNQYTAAAAHALPGAVTYADLASNLADRKSTRLNSSHRCSSSAVFSSKVTWGTPGGKDYMIESYGRD